MATEWKSIIEDPEFRTLSPAGQLELRAAWFDKVVAPDMAGDGISPESIAALRDKALTEFDNGQGGFSSFVNAAGRGIASTASGVVGGVGAITGSDRLMQAADEIDSAVNNALPINPSLTKTNFVGGALGQAGGVLATAGAGGALAKGLAGVRAIAFGSEAAAMTSGVLSGARGGAQDAEKYGMTGPEYAARVALGGLTEYVTEKLPFGMATETGFAQKLMGGAVKPSRGLTFTGGVVTESLEEGLSQVAQNTSNMALAPDGVETPTLFTGVAGSMAGGAVGGAFFGGVNAAAGVGEPPAPLPPPAGFTASPTVKESLTVPPATPAPPPIPIGKASLNGLPFVFDGTGWQRPATEQELGAEPGMLLRPLDPNDAAEGSVIAALNAKAQAAIRRRAEEKAQATVAKSATVEPAAIDVPVVANSATTEAPPIEEGVPPLPGLLPPPGMRWDKDGNAVPLITNEPNNQTPPQAGQENPEAAPGALPLQPLPGVQDTQAPEANAPQPVEGRAQPLSAPVLTSTGPVPIGSLTLGDNILAPDGTTQQVTGTFPQGKKRVFLLTLTDGSTAPASGDHLWLARCGPYSPEIVTTARLKAGLARGEEWTIPVMGEH